MCSCVSATFSIDLTLLCFTLNFRLPTYTFLWLDRAIIVNDYGIAWFFHGKDIDDVHFMYGVLNSWVSYCRTFPQEATSYNCWEFFLNSVWYFLWYFELFFMYKFQNIGFSHLIQIDSFSGEREFVVNICKWITKLYSVPAPTIWQWTSAVHFMTVQLLHTMFTKLIFWPLCQKRVHNYQNRRRFSGARLTREQKKITQDLKYLWEHFSCSCLRTRICSLL